MAAFFQNNAVGIYGMPGLVIQSAFFFSRSYISVEFFRPSFFNEYTRVMDIWKYKSVELFPRANTTLIAWLT